MAYYRKRNSEVQHRRKKTLRARGTPLADIEKAIVADKQTDGFSLDALEGARDALKTRSDNRTAPGTKAALTEQSRRNFNTAIKKRNGAKRREAVKRLNAPKAINDTKRLHDVTSWIIALAEYPDHAMTSFERKEYLCDLGYNYSEWMRSHDLGPLIRLGWFELVSWQQGENINPFSSLKPIRNKTYGLTNDGKIARRWARELRANLALGGVKPVFGTPPLKWERVARCVAEYAEQHGLELEMPLDFSRGDIPEAGKAFRRFD